MKKSKTKRKVELLIFDVDGVLVDVSGSFHRSTIQTVRHFTGQRVTAAQIQEWKSKGGYNDDWRLTTDWIGSFGGNAAYEDVKRRSIDRFRTRAAALVEQLDQVEVAATASLHPMAG